MMQHKQAGSGKSWFPVIYEWAVIILYIGMYKYSELMELYRFPPVPQTDFPYLELIPYCFAITLYVWVYYRWLMPWLMKTRGYIWILPLLVVCFGYLSKIDALLTSKLFAWFTGDPLLRHFYESQAAHLLYRIRWPFFGIHMEWLFTDFIVFSSILFVRDAYEKEYHRHLVQENNLQLQLDALKGQLNPHFLFNTLNSLYAMSLKYPARTPEQILKLAEMMRYILYDTQHTHVQLDKEIGFLQQFTDMEQQKYPSAGIRLEVKGDTAGYTIAPLLLLPLLENIFKHGALCVEDNGYAYINIEIHAGIFTCVMRNDVLPGMPLQRGGIGLDNMRRRLEVHYPGRHSLEVSSTPDTYSITLQIQLR
ncbi:sensor histidine kinase [Chitinophaga sp. Mgbs1]|uniref:Sensor histidine kinase n=1 Tax=Chitinophaga solisilvae TaxID=1233460 RepID=A0A9Q5GQC1_9BACT|nr:sensor histidine kinase [Chitinophaga solisilvae]